MTLKKQNEDHGVRASNWLLLLCGVNLPYQIYGRWACCARTVAWVRDDILRSQRTNFHFERRASLSFQYWGCGMIFEICALFPPQKGGNVRTMFAPIFSSHVAYMEYNLWGNKMPRRLSAHTPALKVWTALWMLTICVTCTERVLAIVRGLTRRALVRVSKQLQTKFWCKNVLWPRCGTVAQGSFLASLHFEALFALSAL